MKSMKFTREKAKSLFKMASKNIPQSINSLKRSLSISHSNLLAFVSGIHECQEIRHQRTLSSHKKQHLIKNDDLSLMGREGLITEQKESILPRKKVRTRKAIKEEMKIGKNTLELKNEGKGKDHMFDAHFVKLQRQRQKQLANKKYEFVSPSPKSSSFCVLKSKRARPQTVRPRLTTDQCQNYNVSQRIFAKREHPSLSNTQKFWMKRGNTWTHRNMKVKTEQTPNPQGSRTLSELTHYSPKQNNKAVNYLILQLQINLACEKQSRVAQSS